MAHLRVEWYFSIVLIYISLIMSEFKHLFIYLRVAIFLFSNVLSLLLSLLIFLSAFLKLIVLFYNIWSDIINSLIFIIYWHKFLFIAMIFLWMLL